MKPLELDDEVVQALMQHAAEEYPNEACGLILRVNGLQVYAACRNDSADRSEQFRINPEDYCRACDAGELEAIFHSHPDADSRPSMADRVDCEKHEVPWVIISYPDGGVTVFYPSGFIAPLLGRPFYHGILDCWGLCRDWYQREAKIEFPDFVREDAWWERTERSMYEELYQQAGFVKVPLKKVQRGDMLILRVGRTRTDNHAGIYLGDDPTLVSEPQAPAIAGSGPFMLHHLYGRASERVIFGGNWAERVAFVLRPEGK